MKFSLDNKDLSDEFFEDTRLLGIMCPGKDYQFVWQLNGLLGLDFRLNNDIEIQLYKKKRNYFFSVYEFREPTGSLEHYIYNNQFDGEYLLPEFRNLDFLWLMKGDIVTNEYVNQVINDIRSIVGVQLVTELTQEKIKNREHMVF